MDIKKLKAFIVVAEELNFRKSAEILGLSQPPLTRLISSFEEELSTQLFERTTRKVTLTNAGILLLKEGKELLQKVEQVEKEVRRISKLKSGKITIGFSITAFLARLPKIIDEFQERFPHVEIELHHGTRNSILKKLKQGEFDLGFLEGQIKNEDLCSHNVKDESLGILIHRSHPLAKKKSVTLCDLKNETIILHPRKEHPEFHDEIQKQLKECGVTPKFYIKKEAESCPMLVSFKKGILLTIAEWRSSIPEDTLLLPVKGINLQVSVSWQTSNPNPLLKTFLSFITENSVLGAQHNGCLAELVRKE